MERTTSAMAFLLLQKGAESDGGEAVRIADSGADAEPERFPSDSEPVGRLHRDDVLGPVLEQRPEVAGEVEVPEGLRFAPALLPYEEDRRARAVLPAEDGGPQERAGGEVGILHGEEGVRPGSVGVDAIRPA